MIANTGIYWEGNFHFQIPEASSSRDAICIFKKNLASITWNCMSTLERNPSTLPQTETILKGQSVSGISIDQLMQVKNYGAGAEKLISMVSQKKFNLSEEVASELHKHVGFEEALTWGKFRDSDVAIGNVDYMPPESKHLKEIAKKGFCFLQNEIISPKERAIATFLFMARSQFFHDANKRTASLMMNGVLLQNGIYPITIMNRDSEEFHTNLTHFYNSGNATEIMRFFERSTRTIYPYSEQDEPIISVVSPKKGYKADPSLESRYSAQLKTLVEAKESQISRLESRLEACVSRQQETLTRTCASRPNVVARLWRGKAWEETMKREQARLNTLEKRLSRVRGIRAAMGGKRLEEFARKKLQRTDPALVSRHDAEERLRREHQVEESLRLAPEKQQTRTQGRGRSLTRD